MGVQMIQKAITRERFVFILGKLHLNENTKIDTTNPDKLWKLKPLIEHLNNLFQVNRMPKERLSVDESMIRFKGRSSFKQYNPMKPIKRGYKVWCIADKCGYVYKFEIYTGKRKDSDCQLNADLGLGGNVVVSLTNSLHDKNHKVFFDNFFSNISLLEYLQGKKVLACGTIRSNRKDFPSLADDKTLARGDYDYRSAPNAITVYK